LGRGLVLLAVGRSCIGAGELASELASGIVHDLRGCRVPTPCGFAFVQKRQGVVQKVRNVRNGIEQNKIAIANM